MISKKILMSILTLAFIGVVAAGTWADYTGTATANGAQNSITAGKVGVTVTQNIGAIGTGTGVTPIKPGWTATGPLTMVVTNSGNLPIGKVTADLIVNNNDLSNALLFTNAALSANGQNSAPILGSGLTLFSGLNGNQLVLTLPTGSEIQPGQTVTLTLTGVSLPQTATQGAGLTATVTATFTAQQA